MVGLKPFQIRDKTRTGKPKGPWRTVYATSEKDAIHRDAIAFHGPGLWEIERIKKRRR